MIAAARFMIGTQSGSVVEVTSTDPSMKSLDICSTLDNADWALGDGVADAQSAQDRRVLGVEREIFHHL
jgi:hypothetical protein